MPNVFNGFFSRIIPNRIHPLEILHRRILARTDFSVYSGPFQGMKYLEYSFCSQFYPKLLGTYEMELSPIVEATCAMEFETIVNAGAAEGYYAVGYALKSPRSGIFAFEVDTESQQYLSRLAELNGVAERIRVAGLCSATSLMQCLMKTEKNLVVMDIEGAESILLDPFVVPHLKRAHILVELHDYLIREIGLIIQSRFSDSHSIKEIWSRDRTIDDLPFSLSRTDEIFFKKYFIKSLSEERPMTMRWFYMEPLAPSSQ